MTGPAARPPSTPAAAAAAARTRAAYLRACRLDVAVRKPGNVSVESAGHRMTAALFIAAAEASAAALCRPGARVGDRIEAATRASWAAAGCNTNLGIVLLCAPLAAAAERLAVAAEPMTASPLIASSLRDALRGVLGELDIDDARAAFRAIAHVNPGGLGRSAEQDVRAEPSAGLGEAMALAAPRDRIALQYVDGFAAVFETGLPALRAVMAQPPDGIGGRFHDDPASPATAAQVQHAYLALLSSGTDSHIVRKHGEGPAQTVMRQAQAWLRRGVPGCAPGASGVAAVQAARTASIEWTDWNAWDDWNDWDEALKADGINPGTTADLTVASLVVDGLLGGPVER